MKPSQLLKSGSISGSGSTIVIYCEFMDVVQEASCVLVYREYGRKHFLPPQVTRRKQKMEKKIFKQQLLPYPSAGVCKENKPDH